MKEIKLNKEEKEIIDAFENDEYVEITNPNELKELKVKMQTAVKNKLAKNKNVNIRISEHDLLLIKERAISTGIPYQTLIGSLIHQYAEGKIKISV